ncbi:hypothetical protein HYX12_03755 [Candidatus Woesearchaeota archaeon]|nr:hypothetical protein [Candidatus Woesearchaeota archaeon]
MVLDFLDRDFQRFKSDTKSRIMQILQGLNVLKTALRGKPHPKSDARITELAVSLRPIILKCEEIRDSLIASDNKKWAKVRKRLEPIAEFKKDNLELLTSLQAIQERYIRGGSGDRMLEDLTNNFHLYSFLQSMIINFSHSFDEYALHDLDHELSLFGSWG